MGLWLAPGLWAGGGCVLGRTGVARLLWSPILGPRVSLGRVPRLWGLSPLIDQRSSSPRLDAMPGRPEPGAGFVVMPVPNQTTSPVCHRRPRVAGAGRPERAWECGPWDVFAEVDLSAMSETVGPTLRRARLLSLSAETSNLSATKPSFFVHHFVDLNRPAFASMRRLTKPLSAGVYRKAAAGRRWFLG